MQLPKYSSTKEVSKQSASRVECKREVRQQVSCRLQYESSKGETTNEAATTVLMHPGLGTEGRTDSKHPGDTSAEQQVMLPWGKWIVHMD